MKPRGAGHGTVYGEDGVLSHIPPHSRMIERPIYMWVCQQNYLDRLVGWGAGPLMVRKEYWGMVTFGVNVT